MRLFTRFIAVAGLVAGGLALPGGAAQAAACPGTTGVTVVVDFGSTSSTLCAADASSAGAVLDAVTDVAYVPMYGKGVVCKINGTPSNQTCQRMPPGTAYWAFFHAVRGGSWTYSSSGVADFNPAPGTVIGFAFGSGGAPSSAPPAAAAQPKPKPKPSSSSTPPATKPKPAGTTPAKPAVSTTPSRPATGGGSSAASGPSVSRTSGATSTESAGDSSTTSTTSPGATTPESTGSGETTAAAATTPDSGSPTTLLAGLGLVGLVGAGATYLAARRRAHP